MRSSKTAIRIWLLSFCFLSLQSLAQYCLKCSQADCDGECDTMSSWVYVDDETKETYTSLQSQLSSFDDISRTQSRPHTHTHPHLSHTASSYCSSQSGRSSSACSSSSFPTGTSYSRHTSCRSSISDGTSMMSDSGETGITSDLSMGGIPLIRGMQKLALAPGNPTFCSPTLPTIPPRFRLTISQEVLERWLTGLSGLINQLNEAYKTAYRERQKINERTRRIQQRVRELQQQGITGQTAIDHANLEMPLPVTSFHDYPHLRLLEQTLLQVAGMMQNSLAGQLYALTSPLDYDSLSFQPGSSQFAQLVANLIPFNSIHLHLIADHVRTMMSLLQQAQLMQLQGIAAFTAQHGNDPMNLLDSVDSTVQETLLHIQAASTVDHATLTIVSLSGIISPLNGNNLMIFSIPSGTEIITVLMSPPLGVFVSLNPDAIHEYLCLYLGILLANDVTRSIRMATAREGPATRGITGMNKPAIEPP